MLKAENGFMRYVGMVWRVLALEWVGYQIALDLVGTLDGREGNWLLKADS